MIVTLPILALPGDLSVLLNTDFALGLLPFSGTVTRVAATLVEPPSSGSFTVGWYTGAGGTGSSATLTFGTGVATATWTGSIPITQAVTTLFQRITAAGSTVVGLSGFIEVTLAPEVDESSGEPITVAELRDFARVGTTAEDSLLSALIVAARMAAEAYTGRTLTSRAVTFRGELGPAPYGPWWDGVVDGPLSLVSGNPRAVRLPGPPVQSIGNVYVIQDDDTKTLVDPATYYLTDPERPFLALKLGQIWPVTLRVRGNLEVTYTAGYATPALVPAAIRVGIKVHAAALYESRGDEGTQALAIPPPAVRLYDSVRTMRVAW